MDIQAIENDIQYLKQLAERKHAANNILLQTLHEYTNLLEKYQRDYDALKQKYDDLVKNS